MNDSSAHARRARIAVFASGGGSNFQAIYDATADGTLAADVVLCVSNRSDAGVLDRASAVGIPSVVIRTKDFQDDAEYVSRLVGQLESYGVDLVALAGYLRKIPSDIVRRYHHRMVNIHPALLPSFGGKGMYGRRVHEAVLESGVRWTGVTVHLVDEEYDTGPIILQEPVPVYPGDSVEELAARVLEIEHQLYPRALNLVAEIRVRVEGKKVHIIPDLN
ncbi:MAG: phosphoribosylglycinamide formyltransferase [Rhodothermales bacterium]|nr:phosphoribosylglycinamide formyltransferase [Rhodothermales bacterium]